MFYTISKTLFKAFISYVLLCIGFGFSFFVLNYGLEGERFENPVKAVLKTMTMILGDFDFDSQYAMHKDQPETQVYMSEHSSI